MYDWFSLGYFDSLEEEARYWDEEAAYYAELESEIAPTAVTVEAI